jgi:peptidoglycan hydrolase-like protein with peptidoglycan-binding domain
MTNYHRFNLILSMLLLFLALPPSPVAADELTKQIQRDLVVLGYDPGSISGEGTLETTTAIARFQAEQGLEITGNASPEVAGRLATEVQALRGGTRTPSPAPAQAPASSAPADPSARQAAQQACLQEKIAQRQEAQKKKRGVGRLMSAVSRTASRMGNRDVSRTMGDVYSASQTADDLSAAARDLGVTEDEIAACREL